jgi:hypothetical protein
MLLIPGVIASSYPRASTAFESIASATGTGSSGSITFSSIPSTYQHLQIRINGIVDAGTIAWRIRFNSDTATNYNYHYLGGQNGTVFAGGGATQSSIYINSFGSNVTYATAGIIDIHNYASTTQNKTTRHFVGFDNNTTTQGFLELSSGAWRSTSAITSIEIFMGSTNYTSASTFALYGIKGA